MVRTHIVGSDFACAKRISITKEIITICEIKYGLKRGLLIKKEKGAQKGPKVLVVGLISSRGSSFRIAFSAVYGFASVRFEGNLTFFSTIGAYSLVHFSFFSIGQSNYTSMQ